jgi:hypothetical protein
MENATKRIRKARRQGLARKKDLGPGTRAKLRSPGMAGADNPGPVGANARRKTLLTQRKTRREAPGITRARAAQS